MSNHVHAGEFADGSEWEVVVTREVVLKAYGVAGLDMFEVTQVDSVVVANWDNLPDELTPYQAAAVSALLLEAAG